MSTIKAVARHLGVSVTTVSHALNRPERVAPEMRERVLRAVEELGYAPNPSARSLRTGRTGLLALMLPDICNPFFPELARAVQDEAAGAGLDVLIHNSDAPGAAAQLVRRLSAKRFDGALVVGDAAPGIAPALAALSVPAVHIGHLDDPVVDSVTFDDYAAAYEATAYLVGRGHRRVAHIAGPPGLFSGRERRCGYEQALRDSRLAADARLVYQGDFQRASGAEGMRRLLALDPAPTAVFAANALMAIAALGAALDAGRRVPGHIAIVGYDDIAEMSDVRPRLTTVDGSARAIGQAAARLLLRRLQDPAPRPPETVVLPHTLVRRESA